MLTIDINHHVSLRGYDNASQFLRRNGFSNWISHKLTHHQLTNISLRELEQLCTLFRCTPNDLLKWQPEKNEKDAASHPLHALNKKGVDENMMSTLTYEQLKEISKIVAEKK
jgi:DNA-binding Xre family transcriptional regulator